jgi:hypothetical protein
MVPAKKTPAVGVKKETVKLREDFHYQVKVEALKRRVPIEDMTEDALRAYLGWERRGAP